MNDNVTHDFASECKAIAHVESGAAVLTCYLADGHDGLHWDRFDGVWWTTEDPAEAVAAAATVQVTRLVLAHRRAVKAAAVKAEWQSYLKEGKS